MSRALRKLNPFRNRRPLQPHDTSLLQKVNSESQSENLAASFGPQSNDATSVADHESELLDSFSEADNYGIKVLYIPQCATLDLVFVHGLTGSAYSTWSHGSSTTHWPRDLVRTDLENARIMTFGYDANIVNFWGQAAQDGISGYAKDLLGKLSRRRQEDPHRKIVFIAHSLGGLVIQRALTVSRESRYREIQDIEAYTVGICFLGTPHHGADLAKWGSILTSVANIAKPANSAPVLLLKRDSEMLREVQDGFHNLLEKRKDEGLRIGITCFYETLPVVRFLVVPPESAIISGEQHYPLHANHVDMTKFPSRTAPGYEDVVGEIKRLASKGKAQANLPDSEPGAGDSSSSSPSLPGEMLRNAANNYNSGTMYVNHGAGNQHNNTGNGRQYNGQIQNFN